MSRLDARLKAAVVALALSSACSRPHDIEPAASVARPAPSAPLTAPTARDEEVWVVESDVTVAAITDTCAPPRPTGPLDRRATVFKRSGQKLVANVWLGGGDRSDVVIWGARDHALKGHPAAPCSNAPASSQLKVAEAHGDDLTLSRVLEYGAPCAEPAPGTPTAACKVEQRIHYQPVVPRRCPAGFVPRLAMLLARGRDAAPLPTPAPGETPAWCEPTSMPGAP